MAALPVAEKSPSRPSLILAMLGAFLCANASNLFSGTVRFPATMVKDRFLPIADGGRVYFGIEGGFASARLDSSELEFFALKSSKRRKNREYSDCNGILLQSNKIWASIAVDELVEIELLTRSVTPVVDIPAWGESGRLDLQIHKDPYSSSFWIWAYGNLVEWSPENGFVNRFEALERQVGSIGAKTRCSIGFDENRIWLKTGASIDRPARLYAAEKSLMNWKDMGVLISSLGCADISRVKCLWTDRSIWCWVRSPYYNECSDDKWMARIACKEADLGDPEKVSASPSLSEEIVSMAGGEVDPFRGFNALAVRDKPVLPGLSPVDKEQREMRVPLPPSMRTQGRGETLRLPFAQVDFLGLGGFLKDTLLVFGDRGPQLVWADGSVSFLPPTKCTKHKWNFEASFVNQWKEVSDGLVLEYADEDGGDTQALVHWNIFDNKAECLPIALPLKGDWKSYRDQRREVVMGERSAKIEDGVLVVKNFIKSDSGSKTKAGHLRLARLPQEK